MTISTPSQQTVTEERSSRILDEGEVPQRVGHTYDYIVSLYVTPHATFTSLHTPHGVWEIQDLKLLAFD